LPLSAFVSMTEDNTRHSSEILGNPNHGPERKQDIWQADRLSAEKLTWHHLMSRPLETRSIWKNMNMIVMDVVFTPFETMLVFWKVVFKKLVSKFSCVCLLLGKLVNGKHFPVKGKFGLVSRKMFSFYFGQKTLSGSCEKFRNVILFVDYIKFGP
jgi:hypothetical protein